MATKFRGATKWRDVMFLSRRFSNLRVTSVLLQRLAPRQPGTFLWP